MCAPEHISLYICSPGTDITGVIGTLPTVICVSQGHLKCFPTIFNVHGNNVISIKDLTYRDTSYRIQQAKGNRVSITKYNNKDSLTNYNYLQHLQNQCALLSY